MSTFVSEVLCFARPIFIEAVSQSADITPVIESTDNEVRLTMHGRQRNGRDIGIRIYQLGTVTRMITTLDPLDRADTSKLLLPPLRYATTPEWLTIRAEASDFDYGPEHFEIVLSQLLAQLLDLPSQPEESLELVALRESVPDAVETGGRLFISTASFCSANVDVELVPFGAWVRATAPVAQVSLTEAQRLRLNDHITFFRTRQDGGQLLIEGEFPAALADSDGVHWLAAEIAMTAEAVSQNLSSVANV